MDERKSERGQATSQTLASSHCSVTQHVFGEFNFLSSGELLSQPRPEGLTEIICPKNGSERINVALVYPPSPTLVSPSPK
ncbi:malignant fibrous histiocytoma-amplified sequence 1 homolog [Tachysurus ichikawai]